MVGMFFVEHPVEVELDGIGIDGSAIMKIHPGAEFESVGLAIATDIPTLGKSRFNLKSAIFVTHEAIINIHQDTEVIDRRHGSWVKRFGFGNLPHHQHIVRCAGLNRAQKQST